MASVDAFEVGNFGFFKDSELTLRMDDGNLYDQIGSNGEIDIWFGGSDVWIPDFGLFNIHILCDQGFFWDIVDENDRRVKNGFTEMQILYNRNMGIHHGDLIPINPDEVFDYTFSSPSVGENRLIASNLWFYNNMFLDEYYRYNLILMHISEGQTWPNEVGARIVPMNDNLTIKDGEYIVGYRPKIEYMNQLAVTKVLTTGKDHSIMFRIKMDLEFIENSPDAVRKIKVFSQSDDTIKYTLYPRDERDIIWNNNGHSLLNPFQRYLLEFGVMQYLPREDELKWGDKLHSEFIESSNLFLQADSYYKNRIAEDMEAVLGGDEVSLDGYSELIVDHFIEWVHENRKEDTVKETKDILKRIILTRKYFKGFYELSKIMNLGFSIPGSTREERISISDPVPELIEIVSVGGVRQFQNGYTPLSAMEYINPKPGYSYSGDIGTGFYKIEIANRKIDVFCDMTTGGGGWMVLIAGPNTDVSYLSNFGDTYFIENNIYRDQEKGIGWEPSEGELSFSAYNTPFSELKLVTSGDFGNPEGSKGSLSIVTSSSGEVFRSVNNGEFQEIIDSNGIILTEKKENIVNILSTTTGGTGDMNSLVIKLKKESEAYYSRRYISSLMVR